MRIAGLRALLAVSLTSPLPAAAATLFRLEPASGGYDVVVDTDAQLDVATVGIRTEGGCADCSFAWDDQRLLDRGLQGPDFLDPGPGGRTGLEKVGSFAASPATDVGIDFFTVQATTLLGGAFGSQEGPLNGPAETTFRLGTLLTAATTPQLVPMAELVPAVGELLVSEFPTVPDRDEDGVGNAADNCLFAPNPEQPDADVNGIGDLCQCGDVNGDGLTNVVDALAIARGEVGTGDPAYAYCDVNGDGACNVTDALEVARGEVSPADQFDQSCPAANPSP
jgi:hypothetical protein